MKKKYLILTAAMAVTSLTASAQYVYREEIPVITATEATEVDDYGFTANWVPITDDDVLMSSKALGYYVRVYAAKTAKTAGEKFYYINTDFSFIKSQYTVDNPYSEVTTDNHFVKGTLNEPNRPAGWQVFNCGQADGVFTLDCKLNKYICNGSLVLSYNDLSKGGGKVHFRFKVRSSGEKDKDGKIIPRTLGIHMRDISKSPNVDVSSHMVTDITNEWKEVEFTLDKGPKQGNILITGEDVGNLTKMFLFIDDLQVWTELNEGETGNIFYEDKFLKDDTEASSLNFSVNPDKLYKGEEFAYTAHAYNLEGIGHDSNMVFVGYGTSCNVPAEDTDISAHSDILYFDKTVGVAGRQVVLSLKMRNKLKAVAYQCDLYLPDGVEVAKNDDGSYKIELSTERTTAANSNVFESAMLPDGCIRILSASTRNCAYNGNDGEVATIVLQLSDILEEGDLPIILRNVEIADANSANNVIDFVKSTLTVSAYTVGDVNNDGRISITDFTAIVKYLMGNAPAVFIEKAADISGDGKISVTDLTSLVSLIMQGTNASPHHSSSSMNSESAYAELSAADCFMGRGMECTVDVKVTGNYDFSAYQFDLDLPEGVSVKMQNGKPCVTLVKSDASDHLPNVFTSGIMPDGSLRVLGATTDGALVNKADGCIARITLVADRDAAYGLHKATVGNIVLAANGHDIEPEPTAFSISMGDATGIDGIDAGEECGDIYDVAGKLVKRNGTINGLKQGIYIMNGKKILK